MPDENNDQISANQQNQRLEADCQNQSGIVRHSA